MAADDETAPYIAHGRFQAGLAHGQFRVVINPRLARPYVVQLTRINAVTLLSVGLGAMLALSGHGLPGLVLAALGVAASRLIRHQAARIVLHLAQQNAQIYADVTTSGVMEVRPSGV